MIALFHEQSSNLTFFPDYTGLEDEDIHPTLMQPNFKDLKVVLDKIYLLKHWKGDKEDNVQEMINWSRFIMQKAWDVERLQKKLNGKLYERQ